MNVTRDEMIDILNKLAGELEEGKGEKWKASTATGESSYSVKIEVTGIALAIDEWPQPPAPPEPDLFDDDERLRDNNTPSPPPRSGKRGGRKSH